MSFIFRDMLAPARVVQAAHSALHVKFKNAWPTHTENTLSGPVEVYDYRYYFYRDGIIFDDKLKRFIVALGMDWEEFSTQSIDNEVNNMWFYIGPGYEWDGTVGFDGTYKDHDWFETALYDPSPGLTSPSGDLIASSINDVFVEDDVIDITISYGGSLKRYITEHELLWEVTDVGIISGGFNATVVENVLLSNPWYYIVNSRHLPYTKDSNQFQLYDASVLDMPTSDTYRPSIRTLPACDVAISLEGYEKPINSEDTKNVPLGLFALMADATQWEPVLVDGSTIFNRNTTTTTSGSEDGSLEGEVLTHTFSLRFKFKSATPAMDYVRDMTRWYDSYYQDTSKIPVTIIDENSTVDTYKELLTTSTIDTKPKQAMVDLMVVTESNLTNSLYLNGYLRVDAVNAMKKRHFVYMLTSKMNTDYNVDDASWFEKIVFVVIIIIAIVVAFYSAGAAGGGIPGAIAAGAGSATLVLGVGMMVLSSFGGLSSQALVKQIGAFAQVTGIIALIAGIGAIINGAINQVAKQQAMEQAKSQAAKEGLSQVATDELVNQAVAQSLEFTVSNVIDVAIESVLQIFTAGANVTQQVTTAISRSYQLVNEFIMKPDASKEQDEIAQLEEELKAEEEKYEDDLLTSKALMDPVLAIDYGLDKSGNMDNITDLDTNFFEHGNPGLASIQKLHSSLSIA